MAKIEFIRLTNYRSHIADGQLIRESTGESKRALPQIFWSDNSPWREANLWLFERTLEGDVHPRTIESNAAAIHAYANWLEISGVDWMHFPARKKDRCLVKFRNALKKLRDHGDIAPSTASARMRAVIKFYRWLYAEGLISPNWPMWQERIIGVHLTDRFGIDRTLMVRTTDIAIPNRRLPSSRLEGGLMPVSDDFRDYILATAKKEASDEMFLMLALGFFTGMRLGTICDLKTETLLNATRDPFEPNISWLAVGPAADPAVETKFGVTDQVIITTELLESLREYAASPRRLRREATAQAEDRDLLFLTRFGRRFAERGSNRSSSVNVELHRLRTIGSTAEISIRGFHFHQSRATFATGVADLAIKTVGPVNAVAIVKDLLLHKDEATSLKYIKFVQKNPLKASLANQFSRAFMGSLVERLAHA